MKISPIVLMLTIILLSAVSDARCRTVGESASSGSEYGTFQLYPAEAAVEAGAKRESPALQWVGYGVGVPLFVVALPFGMLGAGVGAALHSWTKCTEPEGRLPMTEGQAVTW